MGSASCALSRRLMARNSRRAAFLGGSSPGSAAGWGCPWGAGAAGCCTSRGMASGGAGAAAWHQPSAMAGACSAGCNAAKAMSRAPAARTVLEYLGHCCPGRQGLRCSEAGCSACVPHLAQTKCLRPWPCCCSGTCGRHALSARGACGTGVTGMVPLLQFLHASKLRLAEANQAAPRSDTTPPMVTTGMGQLVRAVTALWAPSHVRSHQLHCQ